MKKNITRILERLKKGNIRPKDRVKLLVADMASRERDGKALLTEAERYALRYNWTPRNNEEAREHNRFNEGWKNAAYAEMDAKTTYLNATIKLLRASKYISLVLYKNRFTKENKTIREELADKIIDDLIRKYDTETTKETTGGKALNLVLGYLGLELDYAIYLYAFELADEQLQKDLLALYPNARTNRKYLEQEEIIYNLFNNKDKLSQTEKKKLADYNKKKGTKIIYYKEIFKKWLDVKAEATKTIQGLINRGELKTEKKIIEQPNFKNLYKNLHFELLNKYFKSQNQTRQDKNKPEGAIIEIKTIITGESLYNLKGDFNFVKDLREQAEDFKILGALVLFLREHKFVKDYSTLLAFELLFKELSKTFETDLTYSIKEWIRKFRNELNFFTIEFFLLADDIMEAKYKGDRFYHLSESNINELLAMPFDPDKVEPDMKGRVKVYADKIKDILQDDFKNPFDYEK